MAPRVPEPPAPALRAVLAALDSPHLSEQLARHRERPDGTSVPLVPVHPHPVHTLNLASRREVPAVAAAPLVGWRFLLSDGEQVVAAAETALRVDAFGAAHHDFSHFAQGPFVLSTVRALRAAQRVPGVLVGRYQPRLLSLPGLYMMTLWLHADPSEDGLGDLLLPLAPAPAGLCPHRPRPAAELLAELAVRARPLAAA